jgi:hypothetical protein
VPELAWLPSPISSLSCGDRGWRWSWLARLHRGPGEELVHGIIRDANRPPTHTQAEVPELPLTAQAVYRRFTDSQAFGYLLYFEVDHRPPLFSLRPASLGSLSFGLLAPPDASFPSRNLAVLAVGR